MHDPLDAAEAVEFNFDLGSEGKLEFALPDQCGKFLGQSEFIGEQVYSTRDINAFLWADSLCRLSQRAEESVGTAAVDHISSFDFSSASLVDLPITPCDYGIGSPEYFEWCDKIRSIQPNIDLPHMLIFQDLGDNSMSYLDTDEARLARIVKLGIDSFSCRLVNGWIKFIAEIHEEEIRCLNDDWGTGIRIHLDWILYRDVNADGVMDALMLVSGNGGGTFVATVLLALTRKTQGGPIVQLPLVTGVDTPAQD